MIRRNFQMTAIFFMSLKSIVFKKYKRIFLICSFCYFVKLLIIVEVILCQVLPSYCVK